MKRLNSLPLILVMMSSVFVTMHIAASAADSYVQGNSAVPYVILLADDSMSNPDYALLSYHWYVTVNFYINPTNTYGFSASSVVNTISTAANTWDVQTSFPIFFYRGTTSLTAGTRDGYNVISWGSYQAGVIAVTYVWATRKEILETDCRMNTYYGWTLSGQARKMDVQNIITHEFGHWCGLKDLYNDKDYWLTMYGRSDYGLTYARSLGLGDVKGLQAVYGSWRVGRPIVLPSP